MPIRLLPAEVADKIAAGEVVERPASVVKELIENSIDAGASRIEAEVRQGGRRLIRVSDDGCGIPAAEVELAFARHATSKLASAEDLYRIHTLGFRGEALASIGAVSRLTLTTCVEGEPLGTTIRMEGGVLAAARPAARAVGTTVQVENLFFNTPARLKFLRSDGTEASHVARLCTSYALAYPEIRFTLLRDGRQVLNTEGSGHLLDALMLVYGPEMAEEMIPIEASAADDIKVWGYISPPSVQRSNRSDMLFFVNRRWVQDNPLNYAVLEAYQGLLPQRRYPVAVLNVEVASEDVDVNVHPTKREVRFRRSREVFALAQRAVRAALVANSPTAAPYRPQGDGEVAARREVLRTLGHQAWQELGRQALEIYRTGDQAFAPSLSVPSRERPPMLRVLGQMAQRYIVAEAPGGLYLIDQHAAHERIRYEELKRAQDAPVPIQELLEPVIVELTPRQATLLEEHLEALQSLGLAMEPFGEHTFIVRRLPVTLIGCDLSAAVAEIVDTAEQGAVGFSWEEQAVISLACHTAVRSGQTLSLEEMRDLVRQLEQASVPHTCPHGRPTMVHMSQAQLDRQFGRG